VRQAFYLSTENPDHLPVNTRTSTQEYSYPHPKKTFLIVAIGVIALEYSLNNLNNSYLPSPPRLVLGSCYNSNNNQPNHSSHGSHRNKMKRQVSHDRFPSVAYLRSHLLNRVI
jgi:hypothetical protein